MRQALYAEQRGLCIYCECRLRTPGKEQDEAREGTDGIQPIAHWEPIAVAPSKALDWDNLHLSCDSKTTCDGAQGDQHLGLPPPGVERYEEALTYGSLGDIVVRGDAKPALREPLAAAIGDRHSTGVLGLNSSAFCDARKEVIRATQKEVRERFAGKRATKESFERLIAAVLAKSPFPAFVSVQVDWLEKQAGKR